MLWLYAGARTIATQYVGLLEETGDSAQIDAVKHEFVLHGQTLKAAAAPKVAAKKAAAPPPPVVEEEPEVTVSETDAALRGRQLLPCSGLRGYGRPWANTWGMRRTSRLRSQLQR